MLSEEKELPYDRPMLTKNLFGAVSGGAIASVPAEWYRENNVALHLESRITRLDVEKKEVILADGTAYPFDKCVYALGASSFIPPIPGHTLPQVTALRSIADVEKVNALMQGAKNAVVIGGGALGLEAAWELARFGLQVTVLESAPTLMIGKLDAPSVELLIRIAKRKGVQIRTGVQIAQISGTERVSGVKLQDGETVAADLVILSTGVRANIAVAQEAGLATGRAVIVNENMETNVAGVYAAGDCAEFAGANIALWPVAQEMGRVAGANAAGEPLAYEPEQNGMSFRGMGTELYAIGDVGTKAEISYKIVEIKDEQNRILERLYFHHDILCGAILLGDTTRMAGITIAVKERKTLKEMLADA